MDGITLANMSLVSAMMKSLNQMTEMRRLFVESRDAGPMDISPFIRKFAEQLTMLEIDFALSMIGNYAFPHLTRLLCRHFDANPSAAFPNLSELVISGLTNGDKLPNMRLPSLKKLLIIKSYSGSNAEPVIGFILANAKTLTVLEMSGIRLQLGSAVVFPNLMKVDCRGVDSKFPFPALTHLTVRKPVTGNFLSSLPAEQMLSLEVEFHQGKKAVASAISKMKNLKSLILTDSGWGEANETLSGIFDNMHHLEKVQLLCDCRSKVDDRMIATLANQNTMLSDVFFYRITLTDADLTSLSQLQQLTDIRIYHSQKVTTSGVLTLLRGSSRNVIRLFMISRKKVNFDQVTREISLMCEERGTTFDASRGGDFDYEIHV